MPIQIHAVASHPDAIWTETFDFKFDSQNREEAEAVARQLIYDVLNPGWVLELEIIEQDSSSPTPFAWLWNEIARRFGRDAERSLHAAYLAELRRYQTERRARVRREQL